MRKVRLAAAAVAAVVCLAFAAPSAVADELVATQPDSNDLFYFESDSPEDVDRETVSGLDDGEKLLGLDVRPATGGLYVLGDHGNVYVVNTVSHTAQKIASLPIELDAGDRDVQFGVNFNPVADRMRIVTSDDENYSVNPNDGSVTVDGKIQYDNQDHESPQVVAAAYTLAPLGQNTTSLYAIDANKDGLYKIAPPASGVLSDRQALDIEVPRRAGLDIGWDRHGFLVVTDGGSTRLYLLDVVTGDVEEQDGLDSEDGEIGKAGLNGVATLNVAVRGTVTAPPPPATTPTTPTTPRTTPTTPTPPTP